MVDTLIVCCVELSPDFGGANGLADFPNKRFMA